ncbi:MAG: BMC domain-containing protein [Candidatus Latescibacteria bacterium]|jgi:microcompartment protein CcmL/EutN|nr:BMC domain-containing protein [Candidatus Latescibacterota bacterium]
MHHAIGLIELSSVASGFAVGDAMVKAAGVDVLLARTICSGKYMVMIGGEVGSIEESVKIGLEIGDSAVIDQLVLPNVHESLFPAIGGLTVPEHLEALGIIEAFSVASLIVGADAAAKFADVRILEVRLAMALGGKAFVTMTGDVAAVEEAVEVGAALIAERGLLVNKVVIPHPDPGMFREIV